jgi:catechol 2,3-dioxygenase-like lactoylglutathione lyase family enzyme
MFDHVQIKVKSFKDSRPFYEKVLATLNYKIVLEFPNVIGIGTSPHDMFEIAQEQDDSPLSKGAHIAFKAPSREALQDFHRTALSLGATDNGAPDLRDYEEGYYAAFVIDPNGHNLEAVFKAE